MVKIPGLDDLKKMGADLIDSAKSVNLSETVDKLKSKMEALSGKKEIVITGDNPAQVLLASLVTCLEELLTAHALQANTIKKMQSQISDLAKIIEQSQKPTITTPSNDPETKQEDVKK